MESVRSKRRGFMKSKLVMPFHKAPTKPTTTTTSTSSTTSTVTSTNIKVVKPSHYSPTVSSKGYVVSSSMKDHAAVTVINPQPIKKVSFMSTVPCDEAVDLKAANYISCVQERFRLQRLNSERRIGNMVPQDAQ